VQPCARFAHLSFDAPPKTAQEGNTCDSCVAVLPEEVECQGPDAADYRFRPVMSWGVTMEIGKCTNEIRVLGCAIDSNSG
jgi:hypothetical protein